MKNIKVFIYAFVVLIIMFSFAFAQTNTNRDSVLENIVAHTDNDLQFASLLDKSLDQEQVIVVPMPSTAQERFKNIQLVDITKTCVSGGDEVISAYPEIYKMIKSEENSLIIKVFIFIDSTGGKRRIEVYYTGNDWMQYGLIYLITNAGENKNEISAYFLGDLSTQDREDGVIAPMVNPFDTKKLVEFIVADFLSTDGNVKTGHSKVASTSVIR